MTPNFWNTFIPQFSILPAVNMVECNPFCQQKELRKLMDQHGVKLEAYYPLGHGNPELLGNRSLLHWQKNIKKIRDRLFCGLNFRKI